MNHKSCKVGNLSATKWNWIPTSLTWKSSHRCASLKEAPFLNVLFPYGHCPLVEFQDGLKQLFSTSKWAVSCFRWGQNSCQTRWDRQHQYFNLKFFLEHKRFLWSFFLFSSFFVKPALSKRPSKYLLSTQNYHLGSDSASIKSPIPSGTYTWGKICNFIVRCSAGPKKLR